MGERREKTRQARRTARGKRRGGWGEGGTFKLCQHPFNQHSERVRQAGRPRKVGAAPVRHHVGEVEERLQERLQENLRRPRVQQNLKLSEKS